jgi:hypothetical protein
VKQQPGIIWARGLGNGMKIYAHKLAMRRYSRDLGYLEDYAYWAPNEIQKS